MSNNHIFFVYQEEVITQEEVTEEAAPEAAPEAEAKAEETKGLCLKFLNLMPRLNPNRRKKYILIFLEMSKIFLCTIFLFHTNTVNDLKTES